MTSDISSIDFRKHFVAEYSLCPMLSSGINQSYPSSSPRNRERGLCSCDRLQETGNLTPTLHRVPPEGVALLPRCTTYMGGHQENSKTFFCFTITHLKPPNPKTTFHPKHHHPHMDTSPPAQIAARSVSREVTQQA